ncbi:hypothetical protein T190_05550 [Sinorhizobium meliloti CCBAU 01290]|nr:hypothetical protein T190_05550 [Sinorhizobium meliloti CCBAU 01290]
MFLCHRKAIGTKHMQESHYHLVQVFLPGAPARLVG